MRRRNRDHEQLFYSFRLHDVVPNDHQVRAIAAVLDLSWVHAELASNYLKIARPSIDPVLIIRMLRSTAAGGIRCADFAERFTNYQSATH